MTVARLIKELQKLHPRATAFVNTPEGTRYVGGTITGDEVVAPKSDAYLWTAKERPR